ncbi:uncharacterized protein LOC111013312 [Momordica charantia]|uniref:Uncharacterized protein LOC111013312 n=1 Tax=Momordica charantia TaxID=3673 RepID=A0A6J1CQ89_MOMCH|nr:uncharacterized protein LOC111013312 [Momordica charantia]
MLKSALEEERLTQPNHEQAFYSQRGRFRGKGRYFSSRGRGFPQGRSSTSPNFINIPTTVDTIPSARVTDFKRQNTKINQDQGMPNSIVHKIEKLICQICGKGNHTALDCWNRFDHSYQSEEIPKALAAINLNEGVDPLIYADSGATSLMVNDPGTNTC